MPAMMLLVMIAPMMIIVENDGESVGLTEVNMKISKEM